MTSIIRSARLATELKTLPVPSLQADVRKIPVQVQPRAYGQPQEQTPAHSKEQAPPVVAAPVVAPPPVLPTYDEYKQRLGQELAALRQQAIDGGREEGLKQARQSIEAQYKGRLETLHALIASVRDARQRYIEDCADEVLEIVFVAVTKILGAGFATREAAIAVVREAIRCCKERSRMLVKVAPQDLELLNAHRRELLEIGSASEIELVGDEHVKLGGCELEGAAGNLDARLETQLQRLRETLLRVRASWTNPTGTTSDE
jgi:flagellar biosynthesis/type III secretory pathway protein FliH